MDENRLMDGACICDVLVEAPPDKIVAAFGDALKVAENGKAVVDRSVESSLVYWAASWKGMPWTVFESIDQPEDPDGAIDYIGTLLRQADAAIRGEVLDLPHSYSNGLGVAQRAARQLGARAVVVWGSDEWGGIGGGAILDASGTIVRACNVSGPEAIASYLESHERLESGDYDPEDDEPEEEEEEEGLVLYEPGRELRRVEGQVIEFLDGWFRELGASQPKAPPSLWDAWEDYESVWATRVERKKGPRR
jgi:hypothetical protein